MRKGSYLPKRNRLTNIENKFMVMKGEVGDETYTHGINIYTTTVNIYVVCNEQGPTV